MSFPQPIFQLRGTQVAPYYTRGSSGYATFKTGANVDAVSVASGDTGIFGGKVLDVTSTSGIRMLCYRGGQNWTNVGAFSVLARIDPKWTGFPAARQALPCPTSVLLANDFYWAIETTGKLQVQFQDVSGNVILAVFTTNTIACTAGTALDIMVTWDGTGLANSVKVYIDGVLLESLSPSRAPSGTFTNVLVGDILLGYMRNLGASYNINYYLNEFCIFDSVVGAYATRTDFVPSPNALGDDWTDPGVAYVFLGHTYHAGIAGVQTGILDEPATSDVKVGVTYYEGQRTGTYDGSDRWSDPGVSNVASGVQYKANSLTNNKTGTRLVITNTTVRATIKGGPLKGILKAR